jgi:predicted GNAT superfamily acetyltransferase
LAGWQIRPLATPEEYRACVALQEETWGPGFAERVPPSLLKVSQRLGGVAAGAWDESGRLLGFVFGMTGVENGKAVHWSDMLAVRTEIRDSGLGWRLKTYQRKVLLERGVRTCYWTFDPLEARNGHLNLGKLGAVVREYVPNMYGESDSPLHRGLGTDRFVAMWKMDARRVESRLVGLERPPLARDVVTGLPWAFAVEEDTPRMPRPFAYDDVDPPSTGRFLVPVPTSIQEMKARDPGLACTWRKATRLAFSNVLSGRHEVVELIRGEGDLSFYLVRGIRGAHDGAKK